jgi:hypothetical protein
MVSRVKGWKRVWARFCAYASGRREGRQVIVAARAPSSWRAAKAKRPALLLEPFPKQQNLSVCPDANDKGWRSSILFEKNLERAMG